MDKKRKIYTLFYMPKVWMLNPGNVRNKRSHNFNILGYFMYTFLPILVGIVKVAYSFQWLYDFQLSLHYLFHFQYVRARDVTNTIKI